MGVCVCVSYKLYAIHVDLLTQRPRALLRFAYQANKSMGKTRTLSRLLFLLCEKLHFSYAPSDCGNFPTAAVVVVAVQLFFFYLNLLFLYFFWRFVNIKNGRHFSQHGVTPTPGLFALLAQGLGSARLDAGCFAALLSALLATVKTEPRVTSNLPRCCHLYATSEHEQGAHTHTHTKPKQQTKHEDELHTKRKRKRERERSTKRERTTGA